MVRYRVRLRFRKAGELRWISHRDLLRTLERLFRRAGLALSMSEGFHPKPRMSFPLALAVGIEGLDEVMELELAEEIPADELLARLRPLAPAGLEFLSAEAMVPGVPKAQVRRVTYAVPIPEQRRTELESAIARFLASPSCLIRRENVDADIDVRSYVQSAALDHGCLRFDVLVRGDGSARPREVLSALGVADLEQHGCSLSRTQVEVQS